jgi:hypothetical protein
MSFCGSQIQKAPDAKKGGFVTDYLFACFFEEKAIANAAIFADVGSAYERRHDL